MSTVTTSDNNSADSASLVERAAMMTANPSTIVEIALADLATDPGAIYESKVIDALRAIRQKNEAEYVRLASRAKGCKSKLDKLTAPERESHQDSSHDEILQLAQKLCNFHHDPDGRCVAVTKDEERREVYYADSLGFAELIRAAYFAEFHRGIGDMALNTVTSTLSAIGKHQGDQVSVHLRTAKHGDAYFIDLCDDDWRAFKVSKNGWEVVARPPVLFIRSNHMRPFPEPKKPGDINKLWLHLNIPDSRQKLLLAWIIDALRPDTPYPILELCGEQGSAKSSTQKKLRDLIDPNKVPLRGRPKTVEDIYVSASNNHVVSFENLSHLTGEQQDALCTLSTGGGFATRQFYTNGDEHVLECKRPVVINGINPVASQPDLIERAISIETPLIPSEKRREEQFLDAEWLADYPFIITGLLDLFVKALKELPDIKLPQKHRMADYQLLGEAIALAQCLEAGSFSREFMSAINEGVDRSLETFGVADRIQRLMAGPTKNWEGTYLDLYAELNFLSGDNSHWPKSPRGLAGQIKRITPGLRLRGISVEPLTRDRKGAHLRISIIPDPKN